jgi:hypothetical protein
VERPAAQTARMAGRVGQRQRCGGPLRGWARANGRHQGHCVANREDLWHHRRVPTLPVGACGALGVRIGCGLALGLLRMSNCVDSRHFLCYLLRSSARSDQAPRDSSSA